MISFIQCFEAHGALQSALWGSPQPPVATADGVSLKNCVPANSMITTILPRLNTGVEYESHVLSLNADSSKLSHAPKKVASVIFSRCIKRHFQQLT